MGERTNAIAADTVLTVPHDSFALQYAKDNGIPYEVMEDRGEYIRMLDDCQNKRVDTIITKSVSRFGRNTEEALISLRLLTAFHVEVIFESEGINTSETNSELIISIIEAFAQAENEARSAISGKIIDILIIALYTHAQVAYAGNLKIFLR